MSYYSKYGDVVVKEGDLAPASVISEIPTARPR
jgi:hypothetical protein